MNQKKKIRKSQQNQNQYPFLSLSLSLSQSQPPSSFLSSLLDLKDLFKKELQNLDSRISSINSRSDNQSRVITLTNKIDRLEGATLKDVVFSGASGLTDSDIPDSITVTGSQSITTLSLSSTLTVTGASTFTGLSTFNGGILVNNSTSTITNVSIINSTSTNATTTYLSVSNLASTSALIVDNNSTLRTLSGSGLFTLTGGLISNSASSTITNLLSTYSTSTYATSTYLAVSTLASTSQLIVSTGLGVGIATSTAGAFEVTGNVLFGDSINDVVNLNSGILSFANRATTSILSSTINAYSIATSSSAIPLLSFDTSNTRIGFGTTSPAQFLSIASTTYIAGGLGVGVATSSQNNLAVNGIINVLGSGTSTFANGLQLTQGCLRGPDNQCVGGLTGGSANRLAYWTSSTALSQSADLSWNNARFGVGTSTAGSLISFAGDGTASTSLLLSGINTIYASSSTSTILSAINALSFATSTNSTPIISLNGNLGYVGIATSNPSALFSLEMGTSSIPFFIGDEGTSTPALIVRGNNNVGIGSSSPYALFSIEANTTETNLFSIGDTGTSSPLFVVKGSGNVGISTTSPGQILSVAGNLFVGSAAAGGTAGTLRVGGTNQAIITADPGLVAIGRSAATASGVVLTVGAQSTTNYDISASGLDLSGMDVEPSLHTTSAGTDAYGILVRPVSLSNTQTVNNQYGVRIRAGQKDANTTVTTAIGMQIDAPTIGGTTNTGLIVGTSQAAGASILVGGTTNPGFGAGASIFLGSGNGAIFSMNGGRPRFTQNVYHDGTNEKYIATGAASEINTNAGVTTIQWAASGTAGNTITFTDEVTINSSGTIHGAPTGGAKGAGTINAVAVYDDNTLLTDWVFDIYYDGQPKPEDPYYKGQPLYTIEEVEEFTKAERHLPWMVSRSDFEAKRSLGNLVTQIWQGHEQQQVYLFDHEKRLKVLETLSSADWKIDENGKLVVKEIQTDKLCIGKICATEKEFEILLQQSNLLNSASTSN